MVDNTYLDIARAITLEDRQIEYGSPIVNFLRTAIRWSMWLEIAVTPYDVAVMMMDMKIARENETHKSDNLIDTIGYASCIDRMDEAMKSIGYHNGIKTFIEDEWNLARLSALLDTVSVRF